MAVCKECDSQVADNDIFCPYCGIMLTPPAAPPAVEDPMASTIAISALDLEPADSEEAAEAASAEAPQELDSDAVSLAQTAVELGAEAPIEKPGFTLVQPDPELDPEGQTKIEVEAIVEIEPVDEGAAEDAPVDAAEESVEQEQPSAEAAEPGPPSEANEAPAAVTGDAAETGVTSSGSTNDTGGKKTLAKVLAEGTVLNNRYEILRKIGGGGMGAVYLANDRNLGGVQRAVKEMVQSHIEEAQAAKAIEDFRRESMILSSLDHPSIPTIYDYFYDADEGRFYLVMKYISGGDLAGRLRAAPEGRIDELTVAEWGFQIADVLSYLHGLPQRIVYRDLKPSNVMLDGTTGKVMLIDFGIARSVNQVDEKGVTAVGTMGYAPPELFSGNVEPRSDIYSLGSTMFHLMTGADPQNNPLLIFDFDKNPRPRQINPRLSDQIERILMRCVEYSADKRFASALELRDALGIHADNLRAGRVTYGVSEAPDPIALAEQTVFCGFCGQRIVAADMFCAFCGAKQPIAQQGFAPAVSAPFRSAAPTTARLIVDGTAELEAPVYVIEKQENLVGRRDPMSNIFPEVDLSKFDPQTKISRRHARIIHDGTQYLVEDLGSSNGTIIVSKVSAGLRLLPHRPHPLENGDRLRLGDTTLHFLVG